MLPKLAGDVFIGRIFFRELHRDCEQVQRIHRHPAGAIGLSDMPASWQWSTTIENADVVETQKATLKDIHPVGVFAVDPPRKIQQQLLEHTFKKNSVANAAAFLLDLV